MKSKKVLTILLSLAIMVTFMPTFAFAATTDSAGHTYGDTDGVVSANFVGLKVLVAPTCTDYGVGEITCTTPLNGEECGAVKTVKIMPLGHKGGSQVGMTADQIMDHFKMTDSEKKAWHTSHPTWCKKYVYECENCGALVYQGYSGVWNTYSSINDVRNTDSNPWTIHSEPYGLEKCAETFTCAECGLEKVGRTPTESHKNTTKVTKAHKISDSTYVEVTEATCTVCGKVTKNSVKMGEYADSATNQKSITHGATTDVTVPSTEPCKVPNVVNKVCNECGMTVSSTESYDPHTFKTTLPMTGEEMNKLVPGTYESGYLYTCDRCVVCGDVKAGSVVKVGYAPSGTSTVSFEAASAANCEQGSFIVKTTTSADGLTSSRTVYSDTEFKTNSGFEKMSGKWYDKQSKKEVPYTDAIGHKYGNLTPVKAANCTEKGFDAKVCENCGKINHSSVKSTDKALGHQVKEVVVEATCGTAGYTYKTCERCNQYLDKNGKTHAETAGSTAVPYAEPQKYDEVKPVVSLGTECNFVWKVTKPATETEDGEKALVCSVCGTVKEGSQTLIPADIATAEKKAAVEAATPAVEAAADVIDNAATYTAKSVEAVKEAKDMLNAAIASGTAADVKAMTENLQKVTAAAEKKAENGVTAKNKTVKASTKKNKTFKKAAKASNATGKVTFKKANKAGGSKIVVKSNGNVVVKKGLKKGTYKVKFTAKAAGNGTTLAGTSTGTVTVKVK